MARSFALPVLWLLAASGVGACKDPNPTFVFDAATDSGAQDAPKEASSDGTAAADSGGAGGGGGGGGGAAGDAGGVS